MVAVKKNDKVAPRKKRVVHNYIDNRKFFLAMESFYEETQEAKLAGVPKEKLPIPNDYIGNCIFLISKHMGYRPNFSGYSYLEDMVGDGIEDALLHIRNFDPNNAKKNAFGYFSRIIWFAFLRRIAKEKKQQYVKYKAAVNSIANNSLVDFSIYDSPELREVVSPKNIEVMTTFIDDYENTNPKAKK